MARRAPKSGCPVWIALLTVTACQAPEAPTVDAGISLGPELTCDASVATPTWTEVGAERGLLPIPATVHGGGGDAAFLDLDGDGDHDLYTGHAWNAHVYVREGDTFLPIDAGEPADARSLTVGTLDGTTEVFVIGGAVSAVRVQDGTLATRELFPKGSPERAFQGIFPADVDEDGFGDLFAMHVNPDKQDELWWGEPGGMVVSGDTLPVEVSGGMGFDAAWLDWDRDLDLDLYVVNDQGPQFGPNVLYENDGGALIDASDACWCGLSESAMGVSVADFSADGYPDLYVTLASRQVLYEGSASGAFADVTAAVGITDLEQWDMGWGSTFFDIENDGDLDLYEARGDFWGEEHDPAQVFDTTSRLFVQENGAFSEEIANFGLDEPGSWRSVVSLDDNGDGVLDLLVTDIEQPAHLWLSDVCTTNGWLEVEGPIGARVEVSAGGRTQTAWIAHHQGLGGSGPPRVHFGLGDAQEADSVTITLLDGRVLVAEQIAARRVLTVE